MKIANQRIRTCLVLLLALFSSGIVSGQSYPIKPVRLVTGAPPGGGGDIVARAFTQRLTEQMGQQVIVDNRPGAGGVIAAQVVKVAAPDGYTLFQASGSAFTAAPFVVKKQPYDPEQDFAPVTLKATAPLMIAVHPSLPVKSVKDLLVLAKTQKTRLLYASNGLGSFSHLTTEYFIHVTGISMTHVPYKGGSPAVIDTMSGNVQLIITAFPTLIGQIKAGRLRAIAITGAKRSSAMPELPSVAESGYPGFEASQWFGIFLPKAPPPTITDRLYHEFRKAGESPTLKTSLAQEGAELSVTGPQALADYLRSEIAKWRKVIRDSKISLE